MSLQSDIRIYFLTTLWIVCLLFTNNKENQDPLSKGLEKCFGEGWNEFGCKFMCGYESQNCCLHWYSAASCYAAMRMVAGSHPALLIAWEWHIGLALLCGCLGTLEYPITNSCWPLNKSLSLSLGVSSTVCILALIKIHVFTIRVIHTLHSRTLYNTMGTATQAGSLNLPGSVKLQHHWV